MEEKKKSSVGKYIRTALVLMLIVLFPFLSWYYLKKGYDYHVEVISDLGDFGSLEKLAVKEVNGDVVNAEILKGNITVSAFLNASNDRLFQILKDLKSQFDDREDVKFLLFTTDPSLALQNELEQKALLEKGQCHLLDAREHKQLVKEIYSLGEHCDAWPSEACNYVYMTNTELTIRQYYDISNQERVIRMVEQLAVTLPREKKEDPVLDREKEK